MWGLKKAEKKNQRLQQACRTWIVRNGKHAGRCRHRRGVHNGSDHQGACGHPGCGCLEFS